jgi:hypothetical protein
VFVEKDLNLFSAYHDEVHEPKGYNLYSCFPY